jgi:hypothetical protein
MDFILGATVFILILVLAFKYVNTERISPYSDLIYDSDRISSNLMSAGIPHDWTEDNVVIVGLVSSGNILNITKLEQLDAMAEDDYNKLKNLFGIGNDFLISFYDVDSHLLSLSDTDYIGKPETTPDMIAGSEISTVKRYLVHKESNYSRIIRMDVVVWK